MVKIAVLEADLQVNDKDSTAKITQFKQSLDGASSSAGKAEKKIDALGAVSSKAAQGFKLLAASIIAAGTALTVFSTKAAADFESRMSDVNTLLRLNSEDMKAYGNEVLSLSTTVPEKGSVLSASLYDVVSAGINGATESIEVLEEATKLGVAGLADTKSATDLLTTALNAFGLEASDANTVSDVLFKTVKNGKTTVDQLSIGFGKVAGNAAAAGISLIDMQAATAALTVVTGKTRQNQQALAQVFLELTQSGGKLALALDDQGSSLQRMNDLVAQQGIVKGFETLRDELKLSDTQFKNLFSSAEGGNAVFQLLTSANATYFSSMKDMKQGINEVDAAFKIQMGTFNNQYKIFKNKLNVELVKAGQKILPVLGKAVGKLTGYFEDSSGAIDEFTSSFASAFENTILPAIDTIANMVKWLVENDDKIKVIAASMTGLLVPAIYAVTAAIATLTFNPFILTIAVATSAITAFAVHVKNEKDNLIESVQQMADGLEIQKEKFQALADTGDIFSESAKSMSEVSGNLETINRLTEKQTKLRLEAKNVFLKMNEDEIEAIEIQKESLFGLNEAIMKRMKEEKEAVIEKNGDIFKEDQLFADARAELGEEEFNNVLDLIQSREGANDDLNRALLSGDITLTQEKLALIEQFGIASIDTIRIIGETDIQVAQQRLQLAKDSSITQSKLVQSLVQFKAGASQQELDIYTSGLQAQQVVTSKFNANLAKFLKPKVLKIGIQFEQLNEVGGMPAIVSAIKKKLTDPNSAVVAFEALQGINTMAADYNKQFSAIADVTENKLKNISAIGQNALQQIGGGSGGGDALKKAVSDYERALKSSFQEAERAIKDFTNTNLDAQDDIRKDIEVTQESLLDLEKSYIEAGLEAKEALTMEQQEEREKFRQLSKIAKKEFKESSREIKKEYRAVANDAVAAFEEAQEAAIKVFEEAEKAANKAFKTDASSILLQAKADQLRLEQEILSVQEQINATTDTQTREDLNVDRLSLLGELEEANNIVQTQNENQIVSAAEFEEAQRKAALNPLAALIERFDEEKKAREVAFSEETAARRLNFENENIDREMALKEKLNDLKDAYREESRLRKDNYREDLNELQLSYDEKTALRDEDYLQEKTKLETELIEYQNHLATLEFEFSTFLSQLRERDKAFTAEYLSELSGREQATIESVTRLLDSYKKLYSVQGKVGVGFEIKDELPQFAEGGYTGSQGGEVHSNEWVAPSSMLRSMPSVFNNLEKMRKGQSVSNVNNRNNNQNNTFNVNEQMDVNMLINKLAYQINR